MSNLERIESIKGGVIGAIAFTTAYLLVTLLNHFWVRVDLTVMDEVLKIAIALVSGFLFGVTYRYVIRRDQNSHLSDGAVLAFGLIRGLGTTEVKSFLLTDLGLLGLVVIESIICFTVARFVLDFAFRRHWVKPFQ